jgi:hypothetical protein
MFEGNSSDGSYLEEFVKGIVRKEYQVKDHKVWERGLDLQTVNNEIASEMISWYGGFIHSERFSKIVDNLAVLGSEAKYKLFICAGVQPTRRQSLLLKAYGITVLKLPRKEYSSQWKKLIANQLLKQAVITYSTYSMIVQSESDYLPVVVTVADNLDGDNPHSVWSFPVLEAIRNNPDTGWFD